MSSITSDYIPGFRLYQFRPDSPQYEPVPNRIDNTPEDPGGRCHGFHLPYPYGLDLMELRRPQLKSGNSSRFRGRESNLTRFLHASLLPEVISAEDNGFCYHPKRLDSARKCRLTINTGIVFGHGTLPWPKYRDLVTATTKAGCGAPSNLGGTSRLARTLEGNEKRYQYTLMEREKLIEKSGGMQINACEDFLRCFEQDIIERSPGCQIYGFDSNATLDVASKWPRGEIDVATDLLRSRIQFNYYSISDPTATKYRSLQSVMREFGHDWIDILKGALSGPHQLTKCPFVWPRALCLAKCKKPASLQPDNKTFNYHKYIGPAFGAESNIIMLL
ncbi:hypothetical protein B0H13DRAFT_1899081 [Mycena leptocephala]|nr:hypothetical protein B0H13DRAFT_1899081 [Mycena leptocephala]